MAKEDMKLVANKKRHIMIILLKKNTKPDWFCMELR